MFKKLFKINQQRENITKKKVYNRIYFLRMNLMTRGCEALGVHILQIIILSIHPNLETIPPGPWLQFTEPYPSKHLDTHMTKISVDKDSSILQVGSIARSFFYIFHKNLGLNRFSRSFVKHVMCHFIFSTCLDIKEKNKN